MGIFATPSLVPSVVIAHGVELVEYDDGRLDVRRVDAPLGQLGIALETSSPQIATIVYSDNVPLCPRVSQSVPQCPEEIATLSAMTCATTPYTGPSGLGIYIRKQRRERGWDVVDLARKAGLNRKLIYRIENGSTRTASPRNLRKLADVFDMSVADLEASGEASEHGNDTGENHRS